jgi:hypothetical protein
MQKYNVILKGTKARQVAYRYKLLYNRDEFDNNAYLNRQVQETNAFIAKHITSKLLHRHKNPYKSALFDCGKLFGYSNLLPFLLEYSFIRLKE